jgi:hypothetical protein
MRLHSKHGIWNWPGRSPVTDAPADSLTIGWIVSTSSTRWGQRWMEDAGDGMWEGGACRPVLLRMEGAIKPGALL